MAEINAVTTLTRDGEVAIITLNSPPVNALSSKVRGGLFEGFTQANASDAKAIVLICDGRTFIAGADITEFGGADRGPGLGVIQDLMESSPKPVIAAIHGTALGGGLEVALAAHYRTAVPSAKCGLPEVNLGLIPGAGGTQRLPRIVGVEAALELVTSGRHVPAPAALKMGLVDELVEEGKLLEQSVAFARKIVAENRPLKKVRDSDEKLQAAKGHPEIFENFRKANARKFRGFLAPEYNIRAIEAAVNLPFDEGIKKEAELFQVVVNSPESAAQRYYFFVERTAAKVPGLDEKTPLRPIKSVGVIGAGTMGGGIAMNFANIGVPVTLIEMNQANLDRGLGVIRKNYEISASRGGMKPEQVEERMSKLSGSLDIAALKDVDLVIEAVFENMAVKKEMFAKLDGVCKPGAILATNTSFLDVNEIASATKRPQDVVGLHFFSPANVMKLLEVVRGDKTADDVIATAMKLGKQIGKIAILSGVCHGFIANRTLNARTTQSEKMAIEGADFWDIDRVLYDFGFPMGHFQMLDLVGLDVVKDEPGKPTLRGYMVDAGRLGQKGIGGFYDYDEKRNQKPSPAGIEIVEKYRKDHGINPRKISDEEILDRTLLLVVNEGAKVLEEGIATRASDIDVAWVNGFGWPVYRGGPMWWAEHQGLANVVAKLKALQGKHGDEFKPAALLERLAAEGKGWADFKK